MKRAKTNPRSHPKKPAPAAPSHATHSQLVQIEKPIYGGASLARLEGKALFVPLALPGEQARVHIVEEKRSYSTAEVEELVTAAPERVPAPCPYFGSCGGCQYQHAGYDAQLRFKQAILRETLERAGVPAPGEIDVLAGKPWAYRNRIRLAFDAAGNPGYRGRRSHHVIPIAECPISAPLLVKAALAAAEIFKQLTSSFRPAEIALFCNADENALLVTIFVSHPVKVPLSEIAGSLHEKIPVLRGVDLVAEGHSGQPPRTIASWGEPSLTYRAAGFDYRVDHSAFFQVNRWLVDSLVERVTAGRTGALAWDLFAGVGLFARQLAANFDHIVAVESAPSATNALAHNLSGMRVTATASTTLDFLRRSRSVERPDLIVPDLIVIDPPRTGLGAETTTLLAEITASNLVYVSCDPATLARDLRALLTSGYEIERVTLADLFPQSFHLETIVDLRRA